MKKIKKFTALLLVLAMMVATLAGCGEKKTAAESFFELYDEIYAQKNTESAADMTLELSGEEVGNVTVDAALNAFSSNGGKTGVISGTVGVMGVSLTIPEITVTEDALYLDGKATADLLTLLGVDSDGSMAELIGSSAIAISLTSGESTVDPQKLVDLVSGTAEKVKADLLAREGAIVEDEENKGTYILTIDGALYMELFQLVMTDVIANQDTYIQVILEYAAEDETLAAELDETTLKDFFAELETAMGELETSEEAEEIRAFFDSTKMVVKIGKDADKNYQIALSLEMTVEENTMVMNIDETIKPLSEAPVIETPAETVQLEDVLNAALSAYSYDYEDSYDESEEYYEEELGSVEDLNLTSLGNGLSEFTYYTYGGTAVTVPVPDSFEWDYAYIPADLSTVGGSDSDYNYYATYTSTEKEYFDLEESMGYYYDYYTEDDGSNPMTLTDIVSNGTASAAAIYGTADGYELYDLTITVDCGDEYAIIYISVYDLDTSGVEDVLAYFGLEVPK